MFIQATNLNPLKPILVNANRVESVFHGRGDTSVLHMATGSPIHVDEDFNEVALRLSNAYWGEES